MAEAGAPGAPGAGTPPPAAGGGAPPPAAAGGTPPPAAGGTPPPAAPAWTDGMSDEIKGFVQNKGFKGPGDVVDSYRNFEKLQGVPQERLLKLPENMDSPEGRAIMERLGAPKDASGYQLELPADSKDPKAQEWAAKAFAELGVPKTMAENLIKKFNERVSGQMTEAQAARQAAGITAEANLKTEWGAAFEQNKTRVEAAVKTLGLSPEGVAAISAALGPEKAAKEFLKISAATQEAPFVVGTNGGTGVMTPDQAKATISAYKTDKEFMARVARGDTESMAKWTRAHQMLAPGNMNI